MLACLSHLERSEILCTLNNLLPILSPLFFFFFLCLSSTDEEVASLNMIKSAPVGPVAGGIMGCIMVLVLAVYAYRHQIHRRSHQHMSPLAAQGRTDGWTLILLIDHLIKSFLTVKHVLAMFKRNPRASFSAFVVDYLVIFPLVGLK